MLRAQDAISTWKSCWTISCILQARPVWSHRLSGSSGFARLSSAASPVPRSSCSSCHASRPPLGDRGRDGGWRERAAPDAAVGQERSLRRVPGSAPGATAVRADRAVSAWGLGILVFKISLIGSRMLVSLLNPFLLLQASWICGISSENDV